MSNKLTDEKFISIDYSTWLNKYVPMEKELARVKEELEKEKANHTCSFNLSVRDTTYYHPFQRDYDTFFKERFVTVSFDSSHWIPLTEEEIQAGVTEAEICINKALQNARFHGWILTEKEVEEVLKTLGERVKRIEDLRTENFMRINRIPKIIKWLFKIKDYDQR